MCMSSMPTRVTRRTQKAAVMSGALCYRNVRKNTNARNTVLTIK